MLTPEQYGIRQDLQNGLNNIHNKRTLMPNPDYISEVPYPNILWYCCGSSQHLSARLCRFRLDYSWGGKRPSKVQGTEAARRDVPN